MSLDIDTLGRLLAFAALVAGTEFYALVIGRRAARRRLQQLEANREAEERQGLPAVPPRRAFGIEADQHPSSKWVTRWRAMSGSTASASQPPEEQVGESGSGTDEH